MDKKSKEYDKGLIFMWGLVIGYSLCFLFFSFFDHTTNLYYEKEPCFDNLDISYNCKYGLDGRLVADTSEYGKYWHCLENTPYEETVVLYTVRAC